MAQNILFVLINSLVVEVSWPCRNSFLRTVTKKKKIIIIIKRFSEAKWSSIS